MKYVLLCAALFLLFGFSSPRPIRLVEKIEDLKSLKTYLDKFFPLPHKSDSGRLVERLMKMQKFFHLTVTGIMDAATRKLMELPRCGLPDLQEQQAAPRIWNKKMLTYRINNYTLDLPKSKVDEMILKACKVWSDVTQLMFKSTVERADMEIEFASFVHGDDYPFDGEGGVLAHAFSPGEGRGGDVHFDESEKWSETNRGVNLFIVAAHEFGHSLGLSHSNVQGALMFPTYAYVNPDTFRLPADDKQRIQKLYGKKK